MAINTGNSKSKIYIGNAKVSKVYLGSTKIYSSGSTCTYICDGNTYQEEVDEGASCLSPKTFTPAKSGWEFAGWRQDTAANGSVLSSLAMGGAPITLYAVFRQTITLSYNGNSATSGSTAAQTSYRYYNNGNVANPSFTLRSNGFSRSGYTFSKWALNSANGTQYAAGGSITLTASAIMYAVWMGTPHYFTPFTSVTWTKIDEAGTNNFTVYTNEIALSSKKDPGVAFGRINIKATIPTGGCTKVRFNILAAVWTNVSIKCNNATNSYTTQGSEITNNYDFNISGNSIDIEFGISSSTDYFTGAAYLKSIYFYN
ncbi:MAG: InlB B-repeat-containing protein [Acetatifactor sp.]|nr:InlB B-repeat-containing protein [Acetatifactor sp.]